MIFCSKNVESKGFEKPRTFLPILNENLGYVKVSLLKSESDSALAVPSSASRVERIFYWA